LASTPKVLGSPVVYTDEQLEALLEDLESDLVERKESFRGDVPTKAREAVCAFSNDLPGHSTLRPFVTAGVSASEWAQGAPSRLPRTNDS
jgi:hypothetical protein